MPVIAGLASAVIGASSARRAARSQENAANRDLEYQRETRDLIFDRYEPFYEAGQNALAAYNFEMGLGPRPTVGGNALDIREIAGTPGSQDQWQNSSGGRELVSSGQPGTAARFLVGDQSFNSREEAQAYAAQHGTPGTPYGGFQESEDYKFRFGEGTDAVNALAGARGGLNSGRTLQDLTRFGQGFASQERGNYLNRLAGLTDGGMAAAGGQAGAATNAASGTSNALAAIGNAGAAGAIGTGNALMGGLSNGLGLWNYQRQQGQGGNNWLFGGNSWG